jgi:TolB-like protein/Tfp pilus assembly protein PilF/predicted Ser/Thr protein kinase
MIGTTLGRYRVTGKLGEGGMGVVFLAEDTELGREVALKVLPPEMAEDPERLERFRREAKTVAALNHPNIVTIHSIEEFEGTRFLTMERVDGDSLDHVLPPGGLPLAKLFDIAIPLSDAMATAHERGVVHRDLKPANIMLTRDGRVKVLDFGLAKLTETETDGDAAELASRMATLTGAGMVMGTAPYMSPEQLEGRSLDHRTDIFSLGIVLYEFATGRRPFAGDTSASLLSSILRDTPEPVTEIEPELPRHLARIIQHCLEKDPEVRYQSAKDVRNELKSLRREVESGSVTTGSGAAVTVPPRKRPRPGLWAAAGAAAVLILVAGWFFARGIGTGAAGPVDGSAGTTTAAARSEKPSVAVLPFANMSADPDNEYFTDGLTEELISALAKVEGLQIPARTTVFRLKGTDLGVQEVGRLLGVENVLEGSVRTSGNRLRITAQLVKVEDGFNLWSETYDRELEDVFAIQDEIASNIVGALQLTLSPRYQRAMAAGQNADIHAYDFYLRGRGYFRRRSHQDLEAAIEMFTQAIDIDSGFAPAWAGLADCYTDIFRNYDGTYGNLEAADRASQTAVDLGPDLAEAHAARGYALGQRQQYGEAEHEFRRAVELDDTLFETYYYYGTVAFAQGELEKAAEMFEKALQVAPDDERAMRLLPQIYRRLGRESDHKRANQRRLELAEKRLELHPDDIQTVLDGAHALAALGESERSLEWAGRVLYADSDDALLLYNLACFYSVAGEVDSALDALEKSYREGMADPDWMRQDSDLDSIREHPRYVALLAAMKGGE